MASTTAGGDDPADLDSAYWTYVFTCIFSISIFNIIGNVLIIQAIVKNEWVSRVIIHCHISWS